MERDHSGEPKDGGNSSKQEEDFLGFSPSSDKGKSDVTISRADVAQANAMARQLHVFKPGIDFVPGARLEVLESRDNNWYQCKIVIVDWGELDILVHYERWSNRFNEWLKMDSTRIRPLVRSSQRKDKRHGQFRVGDRVTARWAADGKRYQARVVKILGDEQYEVLFFDGVTKVVRSGALTKFESKPPGTSETGEEGESASSSCSPSKHSGPDDDEMMLLSPAATTASSTDSRSSSPEPDQHSVDSIKEEELPEVEAVTTPIKKSIFDVEIIDQKRKPKRKAAVEELFQSLKKKRKYEHHGKKEDTPTSPKYPQTSRVVSSSPRHQPPVRSTQVRKAPASRKRSRDSACVTEEEGPLLKQTESLFPTETPESTSSSCDTSAQSHHSNLVTVELDSGWKKCCTRRTHGTTAGKWDMFYIAPEGKKIRCKNDLLRYCEETGQTYDLDKFDFSVKNMKDAIEAYLQEAETKEAPVTSHPPKDQKESSKDVDAFEIKEEKIDQDEKTAALEIAENSKAPSAKKSEAKKPETKRLDVKLSDSPRIKIEIPILPKTENIGTLSSSMQSCSASPWSPTMPLALPRSLPASATTCSAVATIKEEPPSVEVDPATVSDSGAELSKPDFTPPARQKHMVKKDPVLAPNEFVVRAEHNEHQCPKEGCGKGFRKENLLQMHIKHYHPEILKKSSSWAPNVADLAYARTVGDHLDLNMSPTHSSPPVDKILKQEGSSKKLSRGVVSGSSGDSRSKIGEKKPQGPSRGASTSKDTKKKDSSKVEPETTKTTSEDELDIKEEIDDYVDDLEEDTPLVRDVEPEDPDYVPCEGEIVQKKKDRKEKRKTRGDSKGKKRKSVPSESMSEDDMQETKAVTKYRYSKRKGSATPKINISATNDTFAPEATVSTTPVKKVHCSEETSNLEVEEDTTDTWAEGAENASVQETSAEIINCGCGSTEEEGLMLQCDVCLCWQHGACYNIVGEDQVPDKYICSLCDHPKLERSSNKFRHHQDWLKEGRLPRFSFSRTRGDARLEACVRRGHELTANVLQLSQVLHSLRLKLHIAKEADHPKFVMWHKKWDEREETSDQDKVSSPADAVVPLHDLMNIVEQDGSNSLMTDANLVTGELESSGAPDTTNASSPVKQSVKSHPSGVWDVTGQIMNMDQLSTQTDIQKAENGSLLQKEPNDNDMKPINYKLQIKDEVIEEDNAMENNSSSETTVSSKVYDTKKHLSTDHEVLEIKQEEFSVSNKVNDVAAIDDSQQSMEMDEHKDMSNVLCDKSDIESVPRSETNVTLMKDNTNNDEPQIESLDASVTVGEDENLTNTKGTLQPNLQSTELQQETKTDSKSTKKLDDLESNKKIEDSKITDKGERTTESDQVTVVDTAKATPLHEDQSAVPPEPYSQKPALVKSVSIEEASQEDLYIDDSAHPEDCACEEMDSQVEEIKREVIFKTEKRVDLNPSIAKKLEENIESECDETQTTQTEGKCGENQRESKDVSIVVKEKSNAKLTMLEENNEPSVGQSYADINIGETEIKSTHKEEKAEEDIHETIKSTITDIKDLPENKVKGENENDKDPNTHPEVMSDPHKHPYISEKNKDSKQNLSDAQDTVKNAHSMEDGETQVKALTEEEVLEGKELDDTKQRELKVENPLKTLETVELHQPSDMGSTDLTQPDDMDGTEDALDDNDTQLDDDGDLALDLGGLGAAGEGGMPGGSDLAALLSSHTELEQLATQASSALAPHVPTSSIVQPVPAPIIPETERIEPVNCKLNLLEHVQIVQTNITKRFDQIEKQLEVLEAEMGLCADTADDDGEEDSEERDPATLQARALIKLILNDVNVVKKIAEFTN
nr:uncharacterized protein LOC123772060 isoform X3 [Procambarus clarkii]